MLYLCFVFRCGGRRLVCHRQQDRWCGNLLCRGGMKASTRFPGTTWLASSRRFARQFNRLYDDDFHNNQIKMINRSSKFSFPTTRWALVVVWWQQYLFTTQTTKKKLKIVHNTIDFRQNSFFFQEQEENKLLFDDNNFPTTQTNEPPLTKRQ